MPGKLWLFLDMGFLGWRAANSTGGMNYKGEWTGTIFGLMRDIQQLMDEHCTKNIAFCFDHGESLRKKIYPKYKWKRDKKYLTEDELEAKAAVRKQLQDVATIYLPDLGYENIFYQTGYEADDMIACCVKEMGKKDKALIVSNDKDMYQFISPKISVWDVIQRRAFTEEKFAFKYKCKPSDWAQVKAIAGCVSDCIPGCRGVGEKYAIRYINKNYPKGTKVVKSIEKYLQSEEYKTFLRLVTLPLDGGVPITLRDQSNISTKKWNKMCEKLGIKTLKLIGHKIGFK